MSTAEVHSDKLRALLAEQAESATLEFIGDCDLDDRYAIVELATEVGAMAARGGWIVVGVDNHGLPTGDLDERKVSLFDEASLRDKLARYIPADLDLRVGRHEVNGQRVVLIYVGAHPDGLVIFAADGTYDDKGVSRTAFRKGECFVRHGTKSERPTQDDIRAIGGAAVERARLWLDELRHLQSDVIAIGELAEAEEARSPDGRYGHPHPTRIPTARRNLAGRLAALEAVGGPQLPDCRGLAESSHFVFLNQFRSACYSATDEIARTLEQWRETV